MGKFRNKIANWIAGPQKRESARVVPPPVPAWAPRANNYAGLFSTDPAMRVAAVYRCVKLLSESVGQMPLRRLVKRGGIYAAGEADPMNYLLGIQPDYHINAVDFFANVVQHILLSGNAYIVPFYDGVTIYRLALCAPGTVSHNLTLDTYTVTDLDNGISGTFNEAEIIHIKGLGNNCKNGLSVLEYAAATLGIARTAEDETYKRFSTGGTVRGFLTNASTGVAGYGEYQDEELDRAAVNIDERINNGQPITALPGQSDFKQISLSSADMQFLESRRFTVRDIARFFGVHPSYLFDDTSNNYKSAEMANAAFLSTTLNPLLRKIEVEFTRKLVSPEMADTVKFEFDRRALYACDLESRARYQTQTIAAGIMTVNEWRQEENMPPVEGGDTPLVSANLKAINELTNPNYASNNS